MNMPTFDELKDLAQRDPQGFELLRAELIDDCIERRRACNQRRLRGCQFMVEGRRRVARSPMKALLDIQGMMYDSALRLKRVLLVKPDSSEMSGPARARILPFRRCLPSGD
ncbi:DUF3135 domain-containing protein [Marinobacter sp. SS13-12]|uniref:DUF3135 domain-containing protein n=1 Tax=Marinobacter sp. SS13-12 TaxID=3050451 RepID=UPI00255577D4|nr:DUF3135 domain-containing protein [Marinobacter sp. SS13-12]MDK8463041.1 DUF3135 domain-containing protein [Marinobacter sp. SS13-12]